MTTAFLTGFDPNAEKFTFQIGKGGKLSNKIFHGTLEEFWPVVEKLNTPANGVEVFVLPNGFAGRQPRAFFVALTTKEQVDSAKAAITTYDVKCDMIVRDVTQIILCYPCADIPVDQYATAQRRLSTALGTDSTIVDLSRIRLPGTLGFDNPDKPQLVELLRNGASKGWKFDDLISRGGSSDKPPEPNDGRIAAEFLQQLRPDGPWMPTAIAPADGAITTITAHTSDEVKAFVRTHDGKRNLYFSANPTRTALNKKAKKTDIAAIEYILGDLDPMEGETSEAAKARYLEQLNGTCAGVPKPTACIDSGNGIQGLWRLQERIKLGKPVNGKFSPEDQAKIDDVEARAAAVMKRLGAKAGTQNIDRILRLPGTTNLPNAKKRKEGRVVCPTRLLWFDDASYPLDALPMPKKTEKAEKKSAQEDETQPLQLPAELRNMLRLQGTQPVGDYPTRSHLLWAFINTALRRGTDENKIIDACLNETYQGCAIYEHVQENGGEDYIKRQIEHAWKRSEEEESETEAPSLPVDEDTGNPIAALMKLRDEGANTNTLMAALNRNFAVVKRGSKVRVAYITGKDIDFMLLDDFHNMLGNLIFKKTVVISKRWFKWKNRRQYVGRGVVFEPGGPLEIPGDKLNLWRGFGIEPKQGDWSLMYNHILEVFCRGNEQHFQYQLKWMAYGVQHLDRPIGTMCAIRGKEGAGKGIVWRNYGRLFGKHFKHITHGEQLTGKFNAVLGDACFVFLDEALWAGDRKGDPILRALVTEDTFQLEIKFFDPITIKNRLRLAAAGNDEWIVPVSPRGRRNFVIDAGDQHTDEGNPAHAAYWDPLQAQFGDYAPDDGRAAMLYDLLHMDLKGFNVLTVPKSAAKTEQKLLTQKGTAAWLFEILQEGAIHAIFKSVYQSNVYKKWEANGMEIVRDDAYQAYLQFSQEQREYKPRSKEWWSRDLRKILQGCISDGRPGAKNADRRRHLIFNSLEKCRKAYGEFLEADNIEWGQA